MINMEESTAAVKVALMDNGQKVEEACDNKLETKSKYHSLRTKILFSTFIYINYVFHVSMSMRYLLLLHADTTTSISKLWHVHMPHLYGKNCLCHGL